MRELAMDQVAQRRWDLSILADAVLTARMSVEEIDPNAEADILGVDPISLKVLNERLASNPLRVTLPTSDGKSVTTYNIRGVQLGRGGKITTAPYMSEWLSSVTGKANVNGAEIRARNYMCDCLRPLEVLAQENDGTLRTMKFTVRVVTDYRNEGWYEAKYLNSMIKGRDQSVSEYDFSVPFSPIVVRSMGAYLIVLEPKEEQEDWVDAVNIHDVREDQQHLLAKKFAAHCVLRTIQQRPIGFSHVCINTMNVAGYAVNKSVMIRLLGTLGCLGVIPQALRQLVEYITNPKRRVELKTLVDIIGIGSVQAAVDDLIDLSEDWEQWL